MEKLLKTVISMVLVSAAVLLITSTVNAMTLAWDVYTDSKATNLRIYQSLDQTNWTILVDNIPTDMVASEIPDHTTDYERVYYMMRAADTTVPTNDPKHESPNSNVISYYWTTGGSGHTGPEAVNGVTLIDCGYYDNIPDDGSSQWDLCMNRHNKP